MAQRLTTRLRTAITKLIKAEEADSFKGCGNPDDYEVIELRLSITRDKISDLLKEVDALEPVLEETPQIVKDFALLPHAQQHLILTGKKWVNPNY